jgi:hypothetical protein
MKRTIIGTNRRPKPVSIASRLVALILVAAGCCSPQLFAQEHSKVDLFGGYQYTHFQPNTNSSGWNASVTANANNWLGFKFDLSGAYKSGVSMQTYMIGPVVSIRKARSFTPFAHFLAGGTTFWGGGSTTGFSLALGGGLDVKVNDHFAVRLLQADWFAFRLGPAWVKENARVSTGVVIRF